MINREISEKLKSLVDGEYKKFSEKLIFTDYEILGVRQPELKNLAKEYSKSPSITSFLSDLPHKTHEENILHGYIIAEEKDFLKSCKEVENFLPYADNWAVCDCLCPKAFKKANAEILAEKAYGWIDCGKTYFVRFGIKTLMSYLLGENFKREYAEKVDGVKSEEYYVKMMQAWYFATALYYNEKEITPFFEKGLSDTWVHNKAIQKSRESLRISNELKEKLLKLKR